MKERIYWRNRFALLLCEGVKIIATRKRSKYGVDQTKKGKEKRTYNGVTYDEYN